MWKAINASVMGTSHTATGTECQDESIADILYDPNGLEYLVCIVADGAGSAAKSSRGAELACLTAVSNIESALQNSDVISSEIIRCWVKVIQQTISREAESESLSSRDYACTLLGAIIGPESAIFFQIGDGAIVLNKNDIQGIVFWPDSGPYANMTYFVTDDNALDNLHIAIVETSINELAIMSDGLQRLALKFDKKLPHTPFFDPMFSVLRQQTVDKIDSLQMGLVTFLNSDQINERTDDDKTLIIATNLNK